MMRAIPFSDKRDHRDKRLAGSIWFTDPGRGQVCAMWFICPCGCGALGRATVGLGHKPKMHGPSWNWNGSRSAATLNPSVNQSKCGWHGWLRNGYWETV